MKLILCFETLFSKSHSLRCITTILQEINDVIEDWQPEPLVPEVEESDLDSFNTRIIDGYGDYHSV